MVLPKATWTCISISFTFAYQINSISVPTMNVDSNSPSEQQFDVFYFSQLVNNRPYVLFITSFIAITSYASFILLLVFNLLIYFELRSIMKKKKSMIGITRKFRATVDNRSITKYSPTFFISGSVNNNKVAPTNGDDSRIKTIDQQKESLRRSLIMTLWVSVIFCMNRLVKTIYRTIVIVNPISAFTYYLNAFSYFCDILLYASLFFVYMKTNKMFAKKFKQIFLCRK